MKFRLYFQIGLDKFKMSASAICTRKSRPNGLASNLLPRFFLAQGDGKKRDPRNEVVEGVKMISKKKN